MHIGSIATPKSKTPLLEARKVSFSFKRTNVIRMFLGSGYRPAMPLGNKKKYSEDLPSSALSQFKKYHPSGNLKFINLGIFQS